MKKIATLLLAAGLVFGVATGASAIDFKAKGQWIMSFDYGQNGGFTGGAGTTGFDGARRTQGYQSEDQFEAKQRVRLQLDAVASEALSGTVFFEMGDQTWGRSSQGGSLGTDGNNVVEVKNAYIDWIVPQTDLKFRMGIQGVALPSFTTKASSILEDDVAAVTASYQFNETVGVTAMWARPYNDNYTTTNNVRNNYMDNVDLFALLVPMTFDGVKVTPWAMYGAMGPNAFRNNNGQYFGNTGTVGNAGNWIASGMVPVGGALHKNGTSDNAHRLTGYGNAVWAGLTGEVTAFDPFRIAWDFNYGSVAYDNSRLNRAGYLGSLLFEYKLDWSIPGLYFWYGSGDDNNPANGSERLPSLHANGNNDFSNFAFNGNPYIAREAMLSETMAGTWGIGARLKDMSFIENLKHTLRLNVMGGTNSTSMARYFSGGSRYPAASNSGIAGPNSFGSAGMDPLYLTTNDTAMEVGLTNTYKMYDNFTIMLDAAYIATWLDQSKSVWGHTNMNGRNDQVRDPWNVNLSFVYSF